MTKEESCRHIGSMRHALVRWPDKSISVIGGRSLQELFFAADTWGDPEEAEYIKLPATVSYSADCNGIRGEDSAWITGKEYKWISWNELEDVMCKRYNKND